MWYISSNISGSACKKSDIILLACSSCAVSVDRSMNARRTSAMSSLSALISFASVELSNNDFVSSRNSVARAMRTSPRIPLDISRMFSFRISLPFGIASFALAIFLASGTVTFLPLGTYPIPSFSNCSFISSGRVVDAIIFAPCCLTPSPSWASNLSCEVSPTRMRPSSPSTIPCACWLPF